MTPLHSEAVEGYLGQLSGMPEVDPVVVEMEQRAAKDGFPIVGRSVGRLLEVQARALGATRVAELGSGFGYSAYWFARAVGPKGHVVCTDGDPDNAAAAEDFLTRAGVWDRVTYRTGDALNGLAAEDGFFDIIYCDVDKYDYPECWRSASERIRPGGLYICDNVLWSGKVADASENDEETEAIREHNKLVMSDSRFAATIAPLRDGVLIAIKLA